MVEVVLSARYARTPAGQTEISARALGLSRAARNLLLVITLGKTLEEWLQAMPALTADEVSYLIEIGLIDRESSSNTPALNPDQMAWAALMRRIDQASYEQLYTGLTAQAKEHLGLLKGYRMVLEVEKAEGLAGLRTLARQFATDLRQSHGVAVLQGLYRLLA